MTLLSPGYLSGQIEIQMRYLCEAEARLSELKIRVKNAKHFVHRRDPENAADELLHVINEARKLRLHLAAWDSHVIPPTKQPHKSL